MTKVMRLARNQWLAGACLAVNLLSPSAVGLSPVRWRHSERNGDYQSFRRYSRWQSEQAQHRRRSALVHQAMVLPQIQGSTECLMICEQRRDARVGHLRHLLQMLRPRPARPVRRPPTSTDRTPRKNIGLLAGSMAQQAPSAAGTRSPYEARRHERPH